MYSTKRVLPQPVGPLRRAGIFSSKAAVKSSYLAADRQVVGLDVRLVLLDRVFAKGGDLVLEPEVVANLKPPRALSPCRCQTF